MLEVRGVHTHYGHIEALHGVSIRVKRGEIVTIIGANGAGKSTLLMTICGRPKPSAGAIGADDGHDLAALDPEKRLLERRCRFTFAELLHSLLR